MPAIVNPKFERSTVFAKQSLPRKSREEMDVRLLLTKCENIAKEEPLEGNWRLKQYVHSLGDMIADIKKNPEMNIPKDALAEYIKRTAFLKGIIQTASLNSPVEKVPIYPNVGYAGSSNYQLQLYQLEAVQLLSHGAATMSADAAAQEIHQKTVVKYNSDLRSELFGLEDNDDSLRKRNIIKAPNFISDRKDQETIDSLLKIHQNMQEKVAENMVMLTKSLKEQSQIASTIIKRDTEALQKSSELTDRNSMSLKAESDRLQVHSRSAWKCWLWIMLAVVMVIFINMVMFMKVMKKRKYDL